MSYVTPPPSGYLVPPPPGAQPPRPGTVSAAGGLLYLLALLGLIGTGLAFYQATFLTSDAIKRIYEEQNIPEAQAEAAAVGASIGIYVGAAFTLAFAALYVVLAVFVGKGKQWARITAWVITGLAVCCGTFGLLGTAASSSLSGMSGQSGVNQADLQRQIQELLPSWLPTVQMVLTAVQLIAALLVIILLLLPPSHPYFRKPEPTWTPPAYPAP